MVVRDVWQVPDSQTPVKDSDWGGTPTLFQDAHGRKLLEAVNKNGYLYVFDRRHLKIGPLWREQIADPDLNISSAAFGRGVLYVAGSHGTRDGIAYKGSIRALNPTNGAVRWFSSTPGSVWPALTYVNGLIIDGAGKTLEVRDADSGQVLFSYKTKGSLYGPASVADGQIFTGSTDGYAYAFGSQ
jgi:outer membrane protein assembly factor BamB